MGNKRTNSLRAAALSLGVKEDLLEAVVPVIKNDIKSTDVSFAIVNDLRRLADENARLAKENAALREVNGDAEKLGDLFDEFFTLLRSNEHGKAFIAIPHDHGEAGFRLLHLLEARQLRLKASRVRLTCSGNGSGCGCACDKTQETSGT